MYPEFLETNLAAIGMNRAREVWGEVKLISKYKDGRHGPAWQSYTVSEQAGIQLRLAAAWKRLGLEPQDRVAIMAPNRPRWVFTLNSLLMDGLVAVPIYPTILPEDAAYILNDSGAKYIVVDSLERAEQIRSVMDQAPALQGIFVMDRLDETPAAPIYALDELIQGDAKQDDHEAVYATVREIGGTHRAAIIYTSGTTGRPKGVVLTHDNFLSQRPLQSSFDLREDDIFLNHLPFCHVFGLSSDLFGATSVKATMVISDGIEPEKIRHALHTIRPTVLMSVPRLFEKIYVQVHQVVSQRHRLVQNLFHGALSTGKLLFDMESEGKPVPRRLLLKARLSRRIANKILRRAGLDRVRLAYAGGAPTSRELIHFYQGLGINLYQGYGLTETSPVATVNLPGKNKLGTVGPPIPGVEVKLAEDGEILIRGGNVMEGYFNNPDATAQAVDEEGWFYSGDIGEIDEDGYLKIIDRKKELIITSGGKNIAPLPIESAFNTDMYIERVVVIGDHRNYLTALICPEFQVLREWAVTRGIDCATNTELASHPEVRKLFEERVALVNQKLARYEQIKTFSVLDRNFTPATGEITPTEKLKRRVIAERYADIIDGMYVKE
ncbi:MAG: hypothetical protein RLZZ303_159 [Candidatus Hydrogenedentota bacterium]